MLTVEAIEAHVLVASRIHADDTRVPVLAKGKTRTGRLWTVVRDDRPFGGHDPPAAAYFYSANRRGAHAQAFLKSFTGVMQADAFSGFGRALRARSRGRNHHRGGLLGPRAPQALRGGLLLLGQSPGRARASLPQELHGGHAS